VAWKERKGACAEIQPRTLLGRSVADLTL